MADPIQRAPAVIDVRAWRRAIGESDLTVHLFELCGDGVLALHLARSGVLGPIEIHVTVTADEHGFLVWINGCQCTAPSIVDVIAACREAQP